MAVPHLFWVSEDGARPRYRGYVKIATNIFDLQIPNRWFSSSNEILVKKIFATDFYLSDAKTFKGVLDELPNDPMSLQ